MDLVTQKGLTFTDICSRTGLNSRTVKNRLEAPWLFNVVELGRMAKLLELTPEALFGVIMTLAEGGGELSPDKLPKGRKAGRPRRPVAGAESVPE
jgi:hypothetical protein